MEKFQKKIKGMKKSSAFSVERGAIGGVIHFKGHL